MQAESKEQWMQRQEQRLKQLMTEQYYRYLSLLRITNNFERRAETYERVNFQEYQGQIAIIGRISEIQSQKQYCFPVLQTPVNRALFDRQENPFAKRGFTAITRKLVVTGNAYRKKIIFPLNKIVGTCKKNKEQLFIFTHLQLLFREEKEVCFGLTDDSYMIQLEQTFYNGVFKNLQQALSTTYSDLSLAQLFPQEQASKGSTFVVMDIRNKIHECLNNFVVVGVLKKVHEQSMKKAVNAKQKEVLLEVVQDVYQPRYRSAGMCRIYVRFDILDEQELLSHLKEGCVYLFLITEVMLSDNVLLNLKLNSWRRNFIRITSSPVRSTNSWQLYKNMLLSQLTYFTNPCIFRNNYKFKVTKYQLKLFYAKVVCESCENSIYRSTSYEYKCLNQEKEVKGELRLWAIVGVMDSSCYGELNIENQAVMNFFNIPQEETARFKEEVSKYQQGEGKSGVVLYFKKTKQQFNEDEPNECVSYDKNAYLASLIQRCLVSVIQKTVIGSGRINTNQNFSVLDQETRHEAMTSFARSREYFKKAKIFVNGNLRTFEGRGRYIPYIKVECVL